jgi:ABC-type sugar transport system permease subunit
MTNVLQSERPAGAAPPAGSPRGAGRHHARERRHGLFFVSPWLLGLLLFYIGPMLATLAMSFTDYHYIDNTGKGTHFIGLANWSRLFNDSMITHSVIVTLKFALLFVPVSVFLPLALAYLLTARGLWARGFFRAAFFLPAIVPAVSALFVWRGFLNADDGWLNRALGAVGITGPDWIGDKLYEAATIDGARSWGLFRHVTLPLISPITFYNVVLTLVGLSQYFIVPFVLTNGTGDPDGSAMFYSLYFFRQTFVFYDAGYGSALAWLMFVVIMAVSGLLFWSQRFWVHYEYEVKR